MAQGVQLAAAACNDAVPAWQGMQLNPESEKVPGRQEVQLPLEE